jgi:hypothetical protein
MSFFLAHKAILELETTRIMDIKIPDRPPADLHPSTSKHPHLLGEDSTIAAQAPNGVHYLQRLFLVSVARGAIKMYTSFALRCLLRFSPRSLRHVSRYSIRINLDNHGQSYRVMQVMRARLIAIIIFEL